MMISFVPEVRNKGCCGPDSLRLVMDVLREAKTLSQEEQKAVVAAQLHITDDSSTVTNKSEFSQILLASEASLAEQGQRYEDIKTDASILLNYCGCVRDSAGHSGELMVSDIEPGGWCFYDSFIHQFPELAALPLDRHSLSLAMLENLVAVRSDFEEAVADDESIRHTRIRKLKSIREYTKHVEAMKGFDLYILDKAEVALTRQAVLDTRCYADDPEIRAWYRACNLHMIKIFPSSVQGAGDMAHALSADGRFTSLTNQSALSDALNLGIVELIFVHSRNVIHTRRCLNHETIDLASNTHAGFLIFFEIFIQSIFEYSSHSVSTTIASASSAEE